MDISKIKKIAVIGAGGWGTAISKLLAENNYDVNLWVREDDLLDIINKRRENEYFLPGIRIPERVYPTNDIREALEDVQMVFGVTPSFAIRGVFSKAKDFLKDDQIIVSATKGFELKSKKLTNEVYREILGNSFSKNLAYLSGPSFAKEVGEQNPTAVVIASENKQIAEIAQEVMSNSYFRVYTSCDVVGVLLGGAVKNVIAIASGILSGIGFGYNTQAGMLPRALVEITRLGERMGGRKDTFSGLAGMGDLILTCLGHLSRNRTLGVRIGRGEKFQDIIKNMKMAVEGVETAQVVYEIKDQYNIEMPISSEIYNVLFKGKDPKSSILSIMLRKLRSEVD